MKRFLLLFVAVIAVAGLRAQSYNVVITTSNGTTISLSANDIGNISFNNGQLVIDGADIAKFATTAKLDSLENVWQADRDMLMAVVKDLYYRSESMTQAVQDSIEALKQKLGVDTVDVAAVVAEVKQQMEAYKAQIDESCKYVQVIAAELQARMEDVQNKVVAQTDAQQAQIDDMQAQIASLKAKIASLENTLDNHISSSTTNQ